MVPRGANCEFQLRCSNPVRLDFALPNSETNIQTVFVARSTGEIAVLAGSLSLGRMNGESIRLTSGHKANARSGGISEISPNAPEKNLWP